MRNFQSCETRDGSSWAKRGVVGFGVFALVCFIAIATARGAEPASADPAGCILLTKEGKVEFAPKGSAQWSAAQTNQFLRIGDRLRTGLRSRATLRWSELSVARVGELTSMEIQPPAKAGNKPELDLKSGSTYFFSREKPTEVQFRTPVASGAIRGTEFHLAVDDAGRTVLSLLDGEVDLAAAQVSEAIKSGEQGIVEPGQPPRKTALINAINVIQWALYYPAVIDPDELGLTTQEQGIFSDALQAYRGGDLLAALAAYPENRQPATDAERTFFAALLLAAGRVEQVETALKSLPTQSRFATALREVIAAVKNQPFSSPVPATASEWMAHSYYLQSRSLLTEALNAAHAAAKKSPNFGAAWVRVAELEFGFGRTPAALVALDKGLALSPRNAQGLALRGFLSAARNNNAEALGFFERAIAVDGALGNAWLGRGLVKIRTGYGPAGRDDLQVAATLEPQRAVLRSYLGKAFSHTRDRARAMKELNLAQKLDPNDPTSWLYSALLNQEENRINQAVRDLELSKELNSNRSVFRSRLLLDQDQAVRGANLAAIYRDAGMREFSAREASRAVNLDYGNHSAHLFLANSYNALRDPKSINLRYETPALSEFLTASLLAPPGAGTLSPSVSQQEYSRLFDADHFGLFSSTEYFSSGDWVQSGAHYGNVGNLSYSLDALYRTEQGQRANNDLEQRAFDFRFKQQLTSKDSVFFQAGQSEFSSGDLAQYYNQANASTTQRVTEKQEPTLLLGYHREWSPGSHTLFLAGRFDDQFAFNAPMAGGSLFLRQAQISGIGAVPRVFTNNLINPSQIISNDSRSTLEAYSAELQHIWQTPAHTLIAGARFQAAWTDTRAAWTLNRGSGANQFVPTNQSTATSLDRISIYAYDHWQVWETLRLTAGVSYDRLHFPRTTDLAPISREEESKDQVSPKIGLQWSPGPDIHLRGAYTRSLGGVFFDQSVRLEPVQIGGFNQAFRSLIPESVVGLVPGTRFETWAAGVDTVLEETGTYIVLEGQFLKSEAQPTAGVFTNATSPQTVAVAALPTGFSTLRRTLDYDEQSLLASINQLVGRDYSVGVSYRLTHANLVQRFPDIPQAVAGTFNRDETATLHQLHLFGIYNSPSGFFALADTVWSRQSNRGYSTAIPGDDFWQFNLYGGYRFFQRRAEISVGLLNLTGQNYRLNPLTLYNELPRERTLAASFKWYF